MKGHLRQRAGRPADYWELEVDAGRDPVTKKRRKITRSFHGSQRDAETQLAELVVEVSRGRGQGTDATFADLLARWLDQLAGQRSPTTLKEYRRLVDRHLVPALGEIPLRRLDATKLDQLYSSLLRHGLAPSSVVHVHAVAHRALEVGVDWGWLRANPAERAHPPGQQPTDVHAPDPEVLWRLLEKAFSREDGRLGLWIHLAAVSGSRRGEVAGLRWTDVDVANATLLIQRAVVDDGPSRLVVKKTKKNRDRRISLDPVTLELLGEHGEKMLKRAADAGVELVADAYLFSDDVTGARPWRPNRATLAFCRLRDSLKITGVRLHDLRHFAATNMLVGGVDVGTGAGRLGHHDTSVFLDVYSHFVPQADRHAAELLGELVARYRQAKVSPP